MPDIETSSPNTNLAQGEACQILYDTYFLNQQEAK